MLWTIAHHASLFMGFSRQEYRRGLPFPPPGDLPNPGIKSASLVSCIGKQVLYHLYYLGRLSLDLGASFQDRVLQVKVLGQKYFMGLNSFWYMKSTCITKAEYQCTFFFCFLILSTWVFSFFKLIN